MTKLKHLWPILSKRPKLRYHSHRFILITSHNRGENDSVSKSNEKNDSGKNSETTSSKKKVLKLEDIEVPTNCCMSGCANCVWITYAEKLSQILKDSPVDIQKIIMDKVQDPNMRAFLKSELKQCV